MKKRIEMAVYTDKGVVDEKNQDRVLLNETVYDAGFHLEESDLPCKAVVCDGVGGYAFGERASQCILSCLAEVDAHALNSPEAVLEAIGSANEQLLELKQSSPELAGMLTTIAGISLQEDKVLVFHAGDSRVYRLRGNYLNKLTRDHSVAQEMIDCGMIKENFEQALADCSRITRFLGDERALPPEVQEFDLPPKHGDLYMLCSDGIWSTLSFDQIEDIMAENTCLEDIAAELSQTALQQGSQDNLSVCLVRVVEEDSDKTAASLALD